MLYLTGKAAYADVEIRPQWPDKHIAIDTMAFKSLCKAQALLPSSIRLAITRAYQAERMTKRISRALGQYLFYLLYPLRRAELAAIFGHNGHAVDGKHIDIKAIYNGKTLHFLPLGVFTPIFILRRREKQYESIIIQIKEALIASGFHIHPNRTEALQIHCDFTS